MIDAVDDCPCRGIGAVDSMSPMPDFFLSTTYLLQKAAKHSLDAAEETAQLFGVTARQYLLLQIASTDSELSQLEIGARLGVDVTVLGRILGDLEDRKLITRTRSPHDRRRHELRITTAGSRLLARATAAMTEAEERVLAALPAVDRARMRTFLNRLSQSW
jgi:DNA-binding MarR family transcriptional regulator